MTGPRRRASLARVLAPIGRTFHKLRPALALCIALLFLVTGRSAGAAGGDCGSVAGAWARRCAAGRHMKVTPVFCVGDRATFRLDAPGVQPLPVEIARAKNGAFRAAPIGDFPNWEQVPAARRALLDKVRACVAAGFDAAAFRPEVRSAGHRAQAPLPAPRLPWRALSAAALAAVVVFLSGRGVRRRRFFALLAAACALAVAAFVFRRVAFEPAFFHQNGQGPDWIGYALGVPSEYGPGYFQLFGLAAGVHPARAEQAVFLQAGLMAALGPVCVLAIARAGGARPLLAWTLALAALAAPGLARLADSETYFGVCTSLLLLAGAVVAGGARTGRLRSWSFGLGVLSSGLFIAQAALVHAVCWMPAALLPLVVFAGRGSLRRRMRLVMAAGLGIAVVVAISSGGMLLHQMHVQARWSGRAAQALGQALPEVGRWLLVPLVVLVLVWRSRPRLRRSMLCVALLPVVAAPALVADKTLNDSLPVWIRFGWWALVLPGGVALVSGALGRLDGALGRPRAARLAAYALLAAALLWFASSWREFTRLPTDALEARFVQSWRGGLPRHSQLAYLQRARDSIGSIPVYRCREPCGIVVHELSGRGTDTPLVLRRFAHLLRENGPVYYYRSSLCSTSAGSGDCAAIERRLELEPIATSRLPARPSVPWTHYAGSHIEVGLFRVRDVHE